MSILNYFLLICRYMYIIFEIDSTVSRAPLSAKKWCPCWLTVEAPQIHSNTQSHWSSESTVCFLSGGSAVHVPGMHPFSQWNQVSPVGAVSLHNHASSVHPTGHSVEYSSNICGCTWTDYSVKVKERFQSFSYWFYTANHSAESVYAETTEEWELFRNDVHITRLA
jgi:hypothetical protein